MLRNPQGGEIPIAFHFSLSTEREKTIIVFGNKVLLYCPVLVSYKAKNNSFK